MGLAGSGLTGLFVLGIFTRFTHDLGAMIGAVASAAVLDWVQQYTQFPFLFNASIELATCIGVGWVASELLPTTETPLDGLTIYDRNCEGA